MRIRMSAARTSAITAVAAATVALTAIPASAQTGQAATVAAGQFLACQITAGPTRLPGATAARPTAVRLWRCDDGWHGQIISAKTGDEIWVTNATGVVTGFRTVPSGATSTNSGTVGIFGSPWRACGKITTSTGAYPPGCTPFG